jgi:cytoskeletal protein CcmA (bactofilin family)
MKHNFITLTVPEDEEAVATFDWAIFPPSVINKKKNFFLIVDEATGITGKLVSWTTYIHGQVDGLIFAEHVQVEKTGHVTGLIFCRTLQVMGSVSANVVCDSVYVGGNGLLSGVVKHKTLRIDDFGRINGSFERRNTTEKPALRVKPMALNSLI